MKLALDPFCFRQFSNNYKGGTKILNISKLEFIQHVNNLYQSGKFPLTNGYAPFCKHLFIPNFCGCDASAIKITSDNQHLLVSKYEARRMTELPVLVRYFEKEKVVVPVAKYLDIILYSKEQIAKENKAMEGRGEAVEPSIVVDDGDYDWGVISVKSQDFAHELPMQPITMMRNSLGKEEGGSGVAIDREAYMKSVKFWDEHASIV